MCETTSNNTTTGTLKTDSVGESRASYKDTMMDRLMFAQENCERIRAVESSFGPSGKPLNQPGRVLIGEGRLMKQRRRGGAQAKVFYLFNDMVVYGSIIVNGRWHKKQKIIPLEDIQLEDLEDGVKMKNQWLIRTPRKSFYVAAASYEEKQAWIKHMQDCQATLLKSGERTPTSDFAVTWIPDQASAICMRCANKFTLAHRRHHCRKCGFVVCGACSKQRAVIEHMHPTKPKRVCTMCFSSLRTEVEAPEEMRERGDSTEKFISDEDEADSSSEDEMMEEKLEDHDPGRWMDSQIDPWSIYVYVKPEHLRPHT